MIGWRAKVGHVAPSRGDILVYEFYRILPEGFLLLNTTGTIRRLVDDHLEKQLARIEEATVDLAQTGAEFIIIGGSPMFTKLGYGSEKEIGSRLSARAGVPVAPGITCEVEALRHLGLKKLVVATPHEDLLNERMSRYLSAAGFEVLKIGGLGIQLNSAIAEQSEYAAYKIAKKLYLEAPQADGIFIPCPRWPTASCIALLEEETGKPAVSSSLANIWYSLHRLHVRVEVRGYGRLLGTLGSGRNGHRDSSAAAPAGAQAERPWWDSGAD